jgi:hypothetical protein
VQGDIGVAKRSTIFRCTAREGKENAVLSKAEAVYGTLQVLNISGSTKNGAREIMTRLIVDPIIQSRLGDGKHILELCDSSGRVLGHFLPLLSTSQESTKEPQISDEEIQRRLREGGGRPLADILTDLEKLA